MMSEDFFFFFCKFMSLVSILIQHWVNNPSRWQPFVVSADKSGGTWLTLDKRPRGNNVDVGSRGSHCSILKLLRKKEKTRKMSV